VLMMKVAGQISSSDLLVRLVEVSLQHLGID
jgi:hypothetical protein